MVPGFGCTRKQRAPDEHHSSGAFAAYAGPVTFRFRVVQSLNVVRGSPLFAFR